MTDVRLELEFHGSMLVARIEGDIDFTNVDEVERGVLEPAGNEIAAIALDLSDTSYVDSAGVRLLFDLARRTEACRQRLAIVVPDDAPLRRLIAVTHLDSTVPVFAALDECLDDLGRDVTDPA